MSDDFFLDAYKAAVAHLEACHDALYAEEAGMDDDVSSPASAPFCGCDDCQVRETLYAAFPILRAGVLGTS